MWLPLCAHVGTALARWRVLSLLGSWLACASDPRIGRAWLWAIKYQICGGRARREIGEDMATTRPSRVSLDDHDVVQKQNSSHSELAVAHEASRDDEQLEPPTLREKLTFLWHRTTRSEMSASASLCVAVTALCFCISLAVRSLSSATIVISTGHAAVRQPPLAPPLVPSIIYSSLSPPPPPLRPLSMAPPLPSDPPHDQSPTPPPSPHPCPPPPVPSPPLPPPPPPVTAELLSQRFFHGTPSNDLSSTGVLIHCLDNRGWRGECDEGPAGNWCRTLGSFVSASLVNARTPSLWSANGRLCTGVVVSAHATRVLCSYFAE